MVDPITQMAIMSGWMRKQRGEPEVAQPGPTMEAWKARIPQDIDGVWPSQPRALNEAEALDLASNAVTPFVGAIRNAALKPAELSLRGIMEMADDRLAKLGKAQMSKLRNVANNFYDGPDRELLRKAQDRLFEESQRRARLAADMRKAEEMSPHYFKESPPSGADMSRGHGPYWRSRKYW